MVDIVFSRRRRRHDFFPAIKSLLVGQPPTIDSESLAQAPPSRKKLDGPGCDATSMPEPNFHLDKTEWQNLPATYFLDALVFYKMNTCPAR